MDFNNVFEGLIEQNEVGMAQERDRDMLRAETAQSPLNFTPRLLKRKLLKKRARLLKEGQLTMIVHGTDETRLWNHRVGMFQRNMRDVLGDRRKTFEWCGSVLDSVVGAFLTQNVSDLLSSRAYMELVSRWPSINKEYPNSDTVDWESVRKASHQDLADAIKCRGMQYNLSTNIKGFLESTRAWNLRRKHPNLETTFDYDVILVMDDMVDVLVSSEFFPRRDDIDSEALYPLLQRDFGEGGVSLTKDAHCYMNTTHLLDVYTNQKTRNASELLSLEWLRQISGNEAHEFLMGIPGLGRKSVACIMLLALGMKEFPVDTNVRIFRLVYFS